MNGCVKFRHLSFALGVASLTFSLACGGVQSSSSGSGGSGGSGGGGGGGNTGSLQSSVRYRQLKMLLTDPGIIARV